MTSEQANPSTSAIRGDDTLDHYRGTFRVHTPERTWSRIAPHLDRVGITRVVDYTGLDDLGIPVFGAVRPSARCHHFALGKGVTPALARISACMEGIEVACAESATAQLRGTTWHELMKAGEAAILPSQFSSTSDLPTGPDLPVDWMRGRTLSGRPQWVPHDAVQLDNRRHHVIAASTNGLASGNTADEAVLHGLLEICERDAIATFLSAHECRLVDLESVADPECRELLDRFHGRGHLVALLDVTNDLGVPTVLAFVQAAPADWIYCGAGAHLNQAVATSRALTEAAQLRLIVRLGIRDDVDDRFDAGPRSASFAVPAWVPSTRLDPVQADEPRSLASDIATVSERLRRCRDLDPTIVDLTRHDIEIPVVKVLAPQAREKLTFFGPHHALPIPTSPARS